MSQTTRSLLWALLLIPFYSFSQTVEIRGELQQWHPINLSFQGPSSSEQATTNPFTDYRLIVNFSLDTLQYAVHGYYAADGQAAESSADTGSIWRVHFVPEAVGTWTYSVSFRTGSNIALSEDALAGTATAFDGLSGNFTITSSDKSGNDLRSKGILRYVGEHYLQFAGDKTYFVKSGTNSPENLLGYADFDNTIDQGGLETPGLIDGLHQYTPHVADWQAGDPSWQGTKGKGIIGALNYLASQGVNSIYFLTYNTDDGDGMDTYMWTSPEDKSRYDCSKLDQWEIVFSHADSLGLQLHLVTQETENNGAMDGLSDERKLYYRELVARFGHHLALQWNIGEENSNSDTERLAFAAYIRTLDPYDHPIVIHSTFDEASTYFDGLLGDANYEGTSIQGNGDEYNAWAIELRTRSAASGRKWAIYGDEQAPEVQDDLSNLDKLRKIYWEQLLGGGAGSEWYFGYQDTFGDVQSEDFRIVEALWQQTALARTFWQQYVPFWEMTPNNSLSQIGTKVFYRDTSLFLLYIPEGGSTSLDISSTSDTLPVQWFNPRTGGDLQTGSIVEVHGTGFVNIGNPPAEVGEDWVAMVGQSNRSPRFSMQPSALRLNMNFEGMVMASAQAAPVPASESDQVVVYTIEPDSISFATINFDTNSGAFSVSALSDSIGSQVFLITANDGQEFNAVAQQSFLLEINPPLPPQAIFTGTPTSGFAPLTVNFDASSSNDPNGPLASYNWNFDGSNTAIGSLSQFTFNTAGAFQVRLIVTDEDGMADTAFQSIQVEELPNEMLFVVKNVNLGEGDQVVKDRLEAAGYTVIVKDEQSATTADASEKALVLISSSVSSSAVNTKFTQVNIPVLSWEAYLFDDLGMTAGGNGSGFGTEWNNNTISILDDGHYMAADLSGTQVLLVSGNGLNWGNPSDEAIKIGIVPGNPNQALLFAYEAAANMVNGTAPARRVGIFIRDNSATALTEAAWQLFDAAVCWAISCPASNPANQAPVLTSIPDQSHEQGESISLFVSATDPEDDQITFTQSGLPASLNLHPTTGEISGTITANPQSYTVSITATDNGNPNEQASISFNWVVTEPIPNQAPVITPVIAQTHEQGESVNLSILATDPDGDAISFAATGLPLGLSINTTSGLISGTITAIPNTYTVTISATDDGDPQESASINFNWTVVQPPPNQAPDLLPISNQSSPQQQAVSLQLSATDPDGDPISFAASNLPAGLSLNSQTGLISGVITAAPGNYAVQISVSDNETPPLSDTESFNWEVTEVIQPLTTIWLEAECADLGSDWTIENDALAADDQFLSTNPGFVNEGNIGTNHTITFTVAVQQADVYNCWIRIKTDNGFNSLWQQNCAVWSKLDFPNLDSWTWFQVNDVSLVTGSNSYQFAKREGAFIDKVVFSIEPDFSPVSEGETAQNCGPLANRPPNITPIPNQHNAPEDNVSLAVIATDPDGDELSYAASGLPPGLNIHSTTGLISGTLTTLTDVYTVVITVSDNGDPVESSTTNLIWTVNDLPPDISGEWSTLNQEPDDRLENGYVKLGDQFFRLGGIANANGHWYNPLTDNWSQDAESLPTNFHHFQGVVIDNILYVISAWNGNNNAPTPTSHVYMYDPTAPNGNRWTQSHEIPEARRRGSAGMAVHEGKIYIAGGVNGGHGSQADSKAWFDVFDPLTGSWEILPDMPRVRDHYHAAVIGDKFYAIGGRNTGVANYINATYTEIDVYDFSTQTWSTLTQSLAEGRGGTMAAVLGHQLMVMGGETGQSQAHTNVDLFDTETLTWKEIPQMPEGRHGTQAVVCDSSVYIAGGSAVNGIGNDDLDQMRFHYGNVPNQNLQAVQESSLQASPNPLNFGSVSIGTSVQQSITIQTAGGNQAVIIDNISLSGTQTFSLNFQASFPIVLNIGQQLELEIALDTQSEGNKSAQLSISHRGSGGSTIVPISANVLSAENFPPVLSNIPNQTHEQGQSVSLQLSATDPNPEDVLSYNAVNLPTGLSLNSATGLISGTALAIPGTYTVTVTVQDNGTPQLSDGQSFDWIVVLPPPNQPPVIAPIANQSDDPQSTISLAVNASDPDGDNLSFQATGLPTGLSINAQTGIITGTITASPGNYPVQITVTDDGDPNLSASISFDWTIIAPPPNQSPTISPIADQSHEQQNAISLAVNASDPDGDNISFQATGLPTGLSINSQTGLITGTITANPGNYFVQITVTDDGDPNLSASTNFNWEVIELVAPITTIWLEAECGDFGSSWNIASDGSASESEYITTNASFVSESNINASHLIYVDLTAEQAGVYSCWIRIQTSNGFNSLWQQTAAGWAKNDFPNLSTWTWMQVEDVALSVGANQLQFAKREGADIDKWVVSIEQSFSPSGQGESAQNCLPEVNLPPVLSPVADQIHEELANVSLQLNASDPNGDQLSFQATGLPAGLTLNPSTGIISGQLTAPIGSYLVNVSVNDNGDPLLSDSESFISTITESLPNQAPLCTGLDDQSNSQGTTISLAVEATDPDGDQLSYSAIGLPASLTIDATSGEISGILNADVGSYSVQIIVEDDGTPMESCSFFFDWEVTEAVVNAELLFVVANTSLSAGDQAVNDRLLSLGYTVNVIEQGEVETSDGLGMGGIIISSSVSSGQINSKFTTIDVPVLCWEAYLFDDLQMTGNAFFSDFGNTKGSTAMSIVDNTHPIAAGLSGTVNMSSSETGLSWGTPTNGASNIANVSGQSSWLAIFAYETGASMVGLAAPARRVGFGLRDETAANMTAQGWALFDAAVCWLTNCPSPNQFIAESAGIESRLSISPNPTTDQLRIYLEEGVFEFVHIQIVDILGRNFLQQESLSPDPDGSIRLSVNHLRKGIYILKIRDKHGFWKKRLIKK